MNNKNFTIIAITALVVGLIASVLELYIGHQFILEPLLSNDAYFIKETYFAPTYYGFIKMLAVALAFISVYSKFGEKNLIIKNKPIATGIIGTLLFGIYYITRTTPSLFSIIAIIIVHFAFISASAYFGGRYLNLVKK